MLLFTFGVVFRGGVDIVLLASGEDMAAPIEGMLGAPLEVCGTSQPRSWKKINRSGGYALKREHRMHMRSTRSSSKSMKSSNSSPLAAAPTTRAAPSTLSLGASPTHDRISLRSGRWTALCTRKRSDMSTTRLLAARTTSSKGLSALKSRTLRQGRCRVTVERHKRWSNICQQQCREVSARSLPAACYTLPIAAEDDQEEDLPLIPLGRLVWHSRSSWPSMSCRRKYSRQAPVVSSSVLFDS